MILGIDLDSQHAGRPLYSGPLQVDFTFYFGFPENMSESKKEKLMGRPHVFKPDISNLIKLIEDVGSKILYHDDCSIAYITAKKCYDRVPRTEFIITEMK